MCIIKADKTGLFGNVADKYIVISGYTIEWDTQFLAAIGNSSQIFKAFGGSLLI